MDLRSRWPERLPVPRLLPALHQILASASAAWDDWLRWPLVVRLPAPCRTSADVFISFQCKDHGKASALAAQLAARGYTVWWANNLVATGAYPDQIDRRLDAAKAVIVIWSPNSVRSKWVRAEASHADYQDKLLNVHTAAIDRPSRQIPKPFGVTHSVPVSDIDGIVAALHWLDVPCAADTPAAAPLQYVPAAPAGKAPRRRRSSNGTRARR